MGMGQGVRIVFWYGDTSSELIEACSKIEGVMSVSSASEAEIIDLESGDVIFFDFDDSLSVGRVRELRHQVPGLKVVVLAKGFEEEKIFKSLEFGIDGYLEMPSSINQVVSAIVEVLLGGAPMSPQVSSLIIGSFYKDKTEFSKYGLTGREREVLSGLAEGFPYKQLASELKIGMGTVRTHIRHLYKKLGVHSRTEAVVKYLDQKNR